MPSSLVMRHEDTIYTRQALATTENVMSTMLLKKKKYTMMEYYEARPKKSNRSTRIDGVAEMVQL
jgi:hypothetical protein